MEFLGGIRIGLRYRTIGFSVGPRKTFGGMPTFKSMRELCLSYSFQSCILYFPWYLFKVDSICSMPAEFVESQQT